MKYYHFTAGRKQWEKPTEPKAVFCPPAEVTVSAETEEEARKLAEKKLCERYYGTGVLLGELKFKNCTEPAADWNYGYGDERRSGTAEDLAALRRDNTK
ncbi:MAG: hypothetical protein ILP09_04355 [Oscillospiraceae bacterium]|nr:hypothetical protein [Oscillospiraceae bacterium]